MKRIHVYVGLMIIGLVFGCTTLLRGGDLTLSWNGNNPPAANIEYVVEQQVDAQWNQVAVINGVAALQDAPHIVTHKLLGLAPGTYTYRVRARFVGATGFSTPSNSATGTIQPSAPSGLVIIVVVP